MAAVCPGAQTASAGNIVSEGHSDLACADSLLQVGLADAALAILDSVRLELLRDHGEDDTLLLPILGRLADFYWERSDLSSAEAFRSEQSRILRFNNLQSSDQAGMVCYEQGFLRMSQGDFVQAESLYTECLYISQRIGASADSCAGYGYYGLACVALGRGEFTRAETLATDALSAWKRAYGEDNRVLFKAEFLLGDISRSQGRLPAARAHLGRAYAIAKSQFGESHLNSIRALTGKALVAYAEGDYTEAEDILSSTLGTLLSTYPQDPALPGHYAYRARVRLSMRRLQEATDDLRRARALLETSPYSTATTLANIYEVEGNIAQVQSNYPRAESLYTSALRVLLDGGDSTSALVPWSVWNIGDACLRQGRLDVAETHFLRAWHLARMSLDSNHAQLAYFMSALADVRLRRGQAAEAESLSAASSDLLRDKLGSEHPALASSLEFECNALRAQGKSGLAFNRSVSALEIRQLNLSRLAPYLSESDALRYGALARQSLGKALSCFIGLGHPDSVQQDKTASFLIRGKGAVTDAMFARERAAEASGDREVEDVADELKAVAYLLSQAYTQKKSHGPSAREEIDSLQSRSRQLESRLGRLLRDDNKAPERDGEVRWQDVAARIPPGAFLVDFVAFDDSEALQGNPQSGYIALILRRGTSPRIEVLDSGVVIDSLVDLWQRHLGEVALSGRMPDQSTLDRYRSLAQRLCRLVWLPVRSDGSADTLAIIGLDGRLNLLSFATLVEPSGEYVIESLHVHYVSTARDLLSFDQTPPTGDGLLALGDPDFSAIPTDNGPADQTGGTGTQVTSSVVHSRAGSSPCLDALHEPQIPLPFTRTEVLRSAESWRNSFPGEAETLLGPDASERNLTLRAPGHRAIHLATHGFFVPDTCGGTQENGNSSMAGDLYSGINPLFRSGLYLAGSNARSASEKPEPESDGLLFAADVASFDLRGTSMVALSACQTGLGAVASGEGVYGLRRAFEVAGARTVVSTLWSIPDAPTVAITTALYAPTAGSVSERLREGQLSVLETLRRRGVPDHPYTWGAFVCQGDWR